MARNRTTAAFTRLELVVMIALLVVLGLMAMVASHPVHSKAARINCVNNLKQIGTAYRIWSNDNGDHFPAFTDQTNGGWSNLLSQANVSAYGWTNDGSAQQVTSLNLRVIWLKNTTTERDKFTGETKDLPTRLIFP